MRKLFTTILASLLLSAALIEQAEAQDNSDDGPSYSVSAAEAQRLTETKAWQIMLALKNRDMRRLSAFVHPTRGVRFSPYVYAEPQKERALSRRQLVSLYRSRRRLTWGEYDGSGDPIRLTFSQYLKRFVYRQDLLKANEVSYNPPGRSGPGTSVNNLLEVYPRAILVVYSHEGITGPQGGAMDWQQLWLVFERLGSNWYLVAIVNNEWTI
ncbi:MAG TPA: hypothetical protein VJS44_20270 [Pyrinomonadaceae bacterium]|nr:hypothetical protein [Pyrinomonadaceae bacterium]